MKRILFQGDSITDADRAREKPEALGSGYAHLIAAELSHANPAAYEFFNRGVGGNTVLHLHDRFQADMVEIAPDIMTLLVGVNDAYIRTYIEPQEETEGYYQSYCELIDRIQSSLPTTKLIILEPFVEQGETSDVDGGYKRLRAMTEQMALHAKAVAERYGIPFIPLQKLFDEACDRTCVSHWLKDGVHPTPAGHVIIKNQLLPALLAL